MMRFVLKETNPDYPDKFTAKENEILGRCKKFYTTKASYLEIVLDIIDTKSETSLSLRALDWFVTNYSKKFDTYFNLRTLDGNLKKFCAHYQYKTELKMYTKDHFDPFCRKRKIMCYYEKDDWKIKFKASIGQLNFFKWAIKNKVIDYVIKHLEKIKDDQKETIRLTDERKNTETETDSDEEASHKKKTKRQPLTSPKNVISFNSNKKNSFMLDLEDT